MSDEERDDGANKNAGTVGLSAERTVLAVVSHKTIEGASMEGR